LFKGLRQYPVARLAVLALFMQLLLQFDAARAVLRVCLDQVAAFVAVLGHARGLMAIDDPLLVTVEMPLSAYQPGDAAGKGVAARAERVEVALFGEIDVANLLRVLIDGPAGVGLVGLAFHAARAGLAPVPAKKPQDYTEQRERVSDRQSAF
jgi:hypothetical protein